LAANANIGILMSAGDGLNVYANRRFAEISAYPVSELLKISVMDLHPRSEAEKAAKRYRKTLAGEDGSNRYETSLVRRDGVIIPIEVSVSRTTWQGKPAVLGIINDISDRKRKEEQLQSARVELELLVAERTLELVAAAADTERSNKQLQLQRAELENVNRELIETNKALTTLARNIDREREDAEKKIVQIVRARMMPMQDSN
jgi:PAS domain S-box-containing protein